MNDPQASPEWTRLCRAIEDDFLNDLERPLSVSKLARRLQISKESLLLAARRAAIVTQRQGGGWIVDIDASAPFIRAAIWRIPARRRRGRGADEVLASGGGRTKIGRQDLL